MDGNISKQYRIWWAKLTPKERRNLIASGAFKADALDDPTPVGDSRVNQDMYDFNEIERRNLYQDGQRDGSFKSANLLDSSTVEQVISNETTPDPRLVELDLASFRLRATLHFLLEALDQSTDPTMGLTADIIRLVVGEGSPPRMTELARRHNITRSAVSLRCRKLLRQLGLEPSRFMRPEGEVHNMRVSSLVRNANRLNQSKNSVKCHKIFPSIPTPPGKESLLGPQTDRTRTRPREIGAKTVIKSKGDGGLGRGRQNNSK